MKNDIVWKESEQGALRGTMEGMDAYILLAPVEEKIAGGRVPTGIVWWEGIVVDLCRPGEPNSVLVRGYLRDVVQAALSTALLSVLAGIEGGEDHE